MSKIDERITGLLSESLSPQLSWNKGLVYNPGFGEYKLGKEGLLATGQLPSGLSYRGLLGDDSRLDFNGVYDPLNLNYSGTLGEGGNFGLNASMPALGGMLGFEANKQDGNNQYWLRYRYGQMPKETPMMETSDKGEILKALVNQYRSTR